MKAFWMKDIDIIKKNLAFIMLIAAESVFLGIFFFHAIFTQKRVVELYGEAFQITSDNLQMENGVLCVYESDSEDNGNGQVIRTSEFELKSGGYEVIVEYDSQVENNQVDQYNAEVLISSQQKIYMNPIVLNDQDNFAKGRIWIPTHSECDDLVFQMFYSGNGLLQIEKIIITESIIYRYIRLIGFIFLFLAVDFIIIALFSNRPLRINKVNTYIIIIAFIASIPFLAKELYYGHDQWFHMMRISSIANEFQNGQFPVRISTTINNGYGYPNSVYYGDIFLYPFAFLYLCFVPMGICYQLYIIINNLFTCYVTYYSLNKISRNTNLNLLGTAVYSLCTYRLINLNIRAAVGEFTAMAFLPLIVAGIYLIYVEEKPQIEDWVLLSIGMTGVVLSHVVTVEIVIVNIGLLCFLLIRKTVKKEKLCAFIKAVLVCLGLSAWFVVPFLDFFLSQKTMVQKEDLRILENTTQEIIYLFQMFSPGEEGGYYITIGASMVFAMIVVLYCVVKYCKNKQGNNIVLRLFAGFVLLNLFFVSSFFPWGRIQKIFDVEGLGYQIGTIQFSWRFLCIVSVLLTFAVVIAMDKIKENNKQFYDYSYVVMLMCIVLSVGFFYYKYPMEVDSEEWNYYSPYSNSDELYLLEGASGGIRDISRVEVIRGDAQVCRYSKEQGIARVAVDNTGKEISAISVPIYAYKYYRVYNQGREIIHTNTEQKCISFDVPANYSGEYQIKFEPPIGWRVAEIVSLLFAIGLCTMFFVKNYKKQAK